MLTLEQISRSGVNVGAGVAEAVGSAVSDGEIVLVVVGNDVGELPLVAEADTNGLSGSMLAVDVDPGAKRVPA